MDYVSTSAPAKLPSFRYLNDAVGSAVSRVKQFVAPLAAKAETYAGLFRDREKFQIADLLGYNPEVDSFDYSTRGANPIAFALLTNAGHEPGDLPIGFAPFGIDVAGGRGFRDQVAGAAVAAGLGAGALRGSLKALPYLASAADAGKKWIAAGAATRLNEGRPDYADPYIVYKYAEGQTDNAPRWSDATTSWQDALLNDTDKLSGKFGIAMDLAGGIAAGVASRETQLYSGAVDPVVSMGRAFAVAASDSLVSIWGRTLDWVPGADNLASLAGGTAGNYASRAVGLPDDVVGEVLDKLELEHPEATVSRREPAEKYELGAGGPAELFDQTRPAERPASVRPVDVLAEQSAKHGVDYGKTVLDALAYREAHPELDFADNFAKSTNPNFSIPVSWGPAFSASGDRVKGKWDGKGTATIDPSMHTVGTLEEEVGHATQWARPAILRGGDAGAAYYGDPGELSVRIRAGKLLAGTRDSGAAMIKLGFLAPGLEKPKPVPAALQRKMQENVFRFREWFNKQPIETRKTLWDYIVTYGPGIASAQKIDFSA